MRRTLGWLVGALAVALLLAAPSSASAVVVGINFDVHQDILNPDLWPNDFHIVGRICSHGNPPVLIDHVDGPFANFNVNIQPDPNHGECWYTVQVNWAGVPAPIPYCTVLHLGVFFEVDSANVIVDLRGWWTRNGQPIPNGGANGGTVPLAGFEVKDFINEPRPPEGQSVRLTNGNQNGQTEPGEIRSRVVQMGVFPVPPGQLQALLGPEPFRELRVGGAQEQLEWIPVENSKGPMSPDNPQDFPADSFFDVFTELTVPPTGNNVWGVARPFMIPPGGFLLVRQLVEFANNAGEPELRWSFEIHGAPDLPACCLPDGTCAQLPAADCLAQNGTLMPPGSRCLGDANGDQRDDICTAKWIQLPDLEKTGIDVNATLPSVLADDWQCTQRSRVTQIRIWGSWFQDAVENPGEVTFILSIHEDIPAGPDGGYSRPGAPVWGRHFVPGTFTWRPYQEGLEEAWYDPAQNYWVFPGDKVCWEYVFNIPVEEAFCQEGTVDAPKVYWLDVQAQLPTARGISVPFGWKTSTRHWNDDAVWGLGQEPYTGPWHELRYPPEHPWAGKSLDLAFTIAGEEPCEQRMDFGDAPEGVVAYPSTGVLGAFPTCMTVGPAPWIQHTLGLAWLGPTVDAEADGNAGLCPGFNPYNADECFSDGDAGLLFPSPFTIDATNTVVPCIAGSPLTALGQVCTPAVWGTDIDVEVHNHRPNQTVAYVNVLIDWDRDGRWAGVSTCGAGAVTPEHVLVNFPIPSVFDGPLSVLGPPNFLIGPQPGVAWMRITISDQPVDMTQEWHGAGNFGDGETEDYLIAIRPAPEPQACCLPDGSCAQLTVADCVQKNGTPQGAGSVCLGDNNGNQRDDLCEAKWVQLPDLDKTGMDVKATAPSILADDWLCTQRSLVTQIRVWGSWYLDQVGDPSNVVFTLSIHKDIPAGPNGYSRPGTPLWGMKFEPGTFLVRPYRDGIEEGWYDPAQQFYVFPGDHVCWEYVFNIPRDEAFCQEGTPDTPMVYWLDVQAQPLSTAPAQFGWKTSLQHWNDDAVWGLGSEPYPGPWNELRYPPGHPLVEQSIDLAFTIAGDEPCERPFDFGDAPEGALAYPATGVAGAFPTCKTVGPATWIQHATQHVWLGPAFDLELDGNAGLCPGFGPYDADECFADGDAGLVMPASYTINAAGNVALCPASPAGGALGQTCTNAVWGTNVDIMVVNTVPTIVFMNVLMDWDQNGSWGGASTCLSGLVAPEHVLVNFPVPGGYVGPLSNLAPPPFTIGPRYGLVWTRFTISEAPVPANWDGSGNFQDGETEDYLLRVRARPPVLLPNVVSVKAHAGVDYGIPFIGSTVTNPGGATNVSVECRRGGVTQAVLPFDVPVTAVDGSIDAGTEVVVVGGTITTLDLSMPGMIIVNMTTTNPDSPAGACVKITLHDIASEVGGIPMADTTVAIAVVRGDVNGSGDTGPGDINAVKAASGVISLNVTPTMFRRDLNVDGSVGPADINLAKFSSGFTAPPCP